MNFWEKLKNAFDWTDRSDRTDRSAPVTAVAKEAAPIPPAGITRDPGFGFRPISQQSQRDLLPMTQERMFEIAYWLYETNGIARGVLETTRDFVVGEGVGFETEDPDVKLALEKFWSDPVNLFDLKLPKKVLELGLYGEQCYPVFTSQYAGNSRLGYIDPANIKEVVADPENAEILVGVALKTRGNKKGKRYQVVLDGDPADMLSAEGLALRDSFADGECYYFTINSVSNATRGRSDLMTIADWLDAYEELLFDRLDARGAMQTYVWDYTFKGLTEEQIKEKLKDLPPPKRGSVFAHNENVERDAIAPDLKADDASKDATMFKNHILGARGIPPTWFAEGGDVNRASAAEMEPRIIKMLTARQKIVIYMVTVICRYQLRRKIAAGELAKTVAVKGEQVPTEKAFSIKAPDISVKDLVKMGAVLQQISTSLLIAENQGWVSKYGAARFFTDIATTFGSKVDPALTADDAGNAPPDPNVTKDYNNPRAQEALRKRFAVAR
jgi:hypothetical protein